jgi:hypothetical protein
MIAYLVGTNADCRIIWDKGDFRTSFIVEEKQHIEDFKNGVNEDWMGDINLDEQLHELVGSGTGSDIIAINVNGDLIIVDQKHWDNMIWSLENN